MPRPAEPGHIPDPDYIVLWPHGTWAYLQDVRRGEFAWMSDDDEIVSHIDEDRLRDVDVLDLLA